jgi:hypothetical protein
MKVGDAIILAIEAYDRGAVPQLPVGPLAPARQPAYVFSLVLVDPFTVLVCFYWFVNFMLRTNIFCFVIDQHFYAPARLASVFSLGVA